MKKLLTVVVLLLLVLAGCAAAESGLPPYAYTGDDLIEGAAAEYTAALGEHFRKEDGAVIIPAPDIFKVETPDDDHAVVYGNFWVFNYVPDGKVLKMISGGEHAAIMTLTRTGDAWEVTGFEQAGDGDSYAPDIKRFCQGDEALLKMYFESDPDPVRIRYIRDYVNGNGLDVEAYQDYGWEPVYLAEEAPEKADILNLLNGREFEFCSGAGAWSTEITFGEDGTFSGLFHDSEMGEAADAYPYGTVYGCLFHGQMGGAEQIDDLTWKLTVLSLEMDEGQVPEAIEDGIRFVTCDPYGLRQDDEVILYLPGTPVDSLPEEFFFWTHLMEIDPDAETLPYLAFWDEAAESGFVSIEIYGMAE